MDRREATSVSADIQPSGPQTWGNLDFSGWGSPPGSSRARIPRPTRISSPPVAISNSWGYSYLRAFSTQKLHSPSPPPTHTHTLLSAGPSDHKQTSDRSGRNFYSIWIYTFPRTFLSFKTQSPKPCVRCHSVVDARNQPWKQHDFHQNNFCFPLRAKTSHRKQCICLTSNSAQCQTQSVCSRLESTAQGDIWDEYWLVRNVRLSKYRAEVRRRTRWRKLCTSSKPPDCQGSHWFLDIEGNFQQLWLLDCTDEKQSIGHWMCCYHANRAYFLLPNLCSPLGTLHKWLTHCFPEYQCLFQKTSCPTTVLLPIQLRTTHWDVVLGCRVLHRPFQQLQTGVPKLTWPFPDD